MLVSVGKCGSGRSWVAGKVESLGRYRIRTSCFTLTRATDVDASEARLLGLGHLDCSWEER